MIIFWNIIFNNTYSEIYDNKAIVFINNNII